MIARLPLDWSLLVWVPRCRGKRRRWIDSMYINELAESVVHEIVLSLNHFIPHSPPSIYVVVVLAPWPLAHDVCPMGRHIMLHAYARSTLSEPITQPEHRAMSYHISLRNTASSFHFPPPGNHPLIQPNTPFFCCCAPSK